LLVDSNSRTAYNSYTLLNIKEVDTMLTLQQWSKFDLFTGIEIFLEWCKTNQKDHLDPKVFEEFKNQLKK